MSLKMVLFDLDGTLLPMDQDVFVNTYFGMLAKKLAPHGYDPDLLVKTVWKGTYAMMKNTGEKTNEEVFWDYFASVFGEAAREDLPLFEDFYENEFDGVREICRFNPQAGAAVTRIREELGLRVALATNPLFPEVATRKRIAWAGFAPGGPRLGGLGLGDSGTQGSGTQDSGLADSGTQGSGLADSGTQDSGLADSGLADSGTQDSELSGSGLANSGLANSGLDNFDPGDFEHYTTYETDRYCKPNPQYYLDFVARLGVAPEDCLMVGNDVADDMTAASLGMKVFLVTDCLINKENVDISIYPHGDFNDLVEYIEKYVSKV